MFYQEALPKFLVDSLLTLKLVVTFLSQQVTATLNYGSFPVKVFATAIKMKSSHHREDQGIMTTLEPLTIKDPGQFLTDQSDFLFNCFLCL